MGSELSRRDGEWLDLVADLVSSPLTRWPDELVCRQLVRTFDAPGAVFHFRVGDSPIDGRVWPPEHFAPHLEENVHFARHEAYRRHPLMRYEVVTGTTPCLQVDEVPSGIADGRILRDWRALGRRWGGVAEQVSLPVRSTPGDRRWFMLGRGDVYTAQDMLALHRLRRLLTGLDRQIDAFGRWSAGARPTASHAVAATSLTPRELVVLDLLSRTLTAAAIARRLAIAERTVQKHLQRIYRKLGAGDRLGAVRRAEYLGLVQPPARTQFPTLAPG